MVIKVWLLLVVSNALDLEKDLDFETGKALLLQGRVTQVTSMISEAYCSFRFL